MSPLLATAAENQGMHLMSGALASIDSFIVFLILAGIGQAINWWQKRKQEPEPPPPRPAKPNMGYVEPARSQGRLSNRQTESRRPAALPKVEAKPELAQALRVLFDLPEPIAPPPVIPTPAYKPTVLATPPKAAELHRLATPLSHLDERVQRNVDRTAQAALARADRREKNASELDETAAAEVASVVPTPSIMKRGDRDVVRPIQRDLPFIRSLRDPVTMRQMIVASAILGPPKGLE